MVHGMLQGFSASIEVTLPEESVSQTQFLHSTSPNAARRIVISDTSIAKSLRCASPHRLRNSGSSSNSRAKTAVPNPSAVGPFVHSHRALDRPTSQRALSCRSIQFAARTHESRRRPNRLDPTSSRP